MRYLGLLFLLILLLTVDWAQAYEIAKQCDWRWIVVAGLLNYLFMLGKSVRWYVLLRMQKVEYPLGKALRVYQAASFFSLLTPGRVGEVLKIAYLKRDIGLAYRLGLPSVAVDRLLDLLMLSLSALVMLLGRGLPGELLWSVVAFNAVVLGVLGFLFSSRAMPLGMRVLARLPLVGRFSERVEPKVLDTHAALMELGGSRLIGPLLISVATYLCIFLGSYALARGQNLPLTFIEVVYSIALTSIVALLPVSVLGLGTRDMTMVFLFAHLGFSREQALMFSFGYLIVNLLFTAIPGAIWWCTDSHRPAAKQLLAAQQ